MIQLLAGDIGGTKTILRLVQADGDDLQHCAARDVRLETLHEGRFASSEFSDLVPLVQQFLTAAKDRVSAVEPRSACFAIAGPVTENTSQLTNLAWSLSGERLAMELHLEQVQLINDFEAIGYGVLGLEDNDFYTLQTGQLNDTAPIAIIGAGTGLGQGFLINTDGRYYVFPSEGGHADFAPRSEIEFQLLRYLLDKHTIARVSAERVVSGQGIVSIYQFLRDRKFATETEALSQTIRNWEQQAGQRTAELPDPAAAISQAALVGHDPLAAETMSLFIGAYGAEAGNLAIKLLPFGGLYVAGGVAAKNIQLIKSGKFMQAFNDKGRMRPLLEKISVRVVMNQSVGLIGAALRATRL
ncbi:MAG: glucokinase [Leptolyngbya sp. SIO4C1]|nr:glucokinase [Leptolyngbya sp. SIO4C1]